MPGARCTRSLACESCREHTSIVTVGSPDQPGIPARNGCNGFLRDLPGDRACLSPSPAVCLRKLDASVEASGPHDFAVRFQRCSSAAPSASIASRPASVTIAIRPFGGTRRRDYCGDLRREETKIFFESGLDSQITDLRFAQLSLRRGRNLPPLATGDLRRRDHCLCAALDSQLLQDSGHVRLDRRFRNPKLVGDLLVEQAFG